MKLKERITLDESAAEERVVRINRVSKVVTGGRRFSLNALVVVGDKNGNIGCGSGKGKEVPDAIRKAIKNAKKNVFGVSLKGTTIPHIVEAEYCSARVLLKPAPKGTGIIAGAAIRSVVEVVGIHDVVSKSLGSDNKSNIVKATLKALQSLRSREDVEQLRGVKIDEA